MVNKTKRSPIWKLDIDKFKELINKSDTIGQVLEYFNMNNTGGNFKTFGRRCKEENIDYSKFKNNFGKGLFKPLIPLNEVLIENSSYDRGHLKKRLIRDGLLKNECSNCGLQPIWDNKNLVMVLDHINGVNNDNRIENLRLLCPNCNSQTDTFSGKTRKKRYNCLDCGKSIGKNSIRCKTCSGRLLVGEINKIERPTKEFLEEIIWSKPSTEIAKMFNVSSKAIENWTKFYGLSKPPRGYWAKVRHGK